MREIGVEKESKEIIENKGKSIIPNDERKKFGLAPIPGGDVAITRISDSSMGLNPED